MSTQTAQKTEAAQALWRLVVEDLIDCEADNQVGNAWKLIQALFAGKHELEHKQITNLESLAGETRSIAVIVDFVRYQMGRDDKKPPVKWRVQVGQDTFGDQVIKHIQELESAAQRVINKAKDKRLTPPNEADEKTLIWWKLVRRYIAYLEHAFVYEKAMHEDRQKAPGGREKR